MWKTSSRKTFDSTGNASSREHEYRGLPSKRIECRARGRRGDESGSQIVTPVGKTHANSCFRLVVPLGSIACVYAFFPQGSPCRRYRRRTHAIGSAAQKPPPSFYHLCIAAESLKNYLKDPSRGQWRHQMRIRPHNYASGVFPTPWAIKRVSHVSRERTPVPEHLKRSMIFTLVHL